jgi:hypothetical protein
MSELTITTSTVFVELFGSIPRIKIIDFLIENRRESWSLTEIATQGRIAYPSVKLAMPALLRIGVVKPTRHIGRIALYTIDSENPIALRIIELRKAVLSRSARIAIPLTTN